MNFLRALFSRVKWFSDGGLVADNIRHTHETGKFLANFRPMGRHDAPRSPFKNTVPPLKPDEVPFIVPFSPYRQGYESSRIGDGGKTHPCPYAEDTPEYEQWWKGFDESTEDYLRDNYEPDQ